MSLIRVVIGTLSLSAPTCRLFGNFISTTRLYHLKHHVSTWEPRWWDGKRPVSIRIWFLGFVSSSVVLCYVFAVNRMSDVVLPIRHFVKRPVSCIGENFLRIFQPDMTEDESLRNMALELLPEKKKKTWTVMQRNPLMCGWSKRQWWCTVRRDTWLGSNMIISTRSVAA